MLGSSAANATPVNRVKAATAQAQKSAIRAFGRPLPPLMTASRSPRHLHRKQRREASTERYRPPELRVDGQSASACHGKSPAGVCATAPGFAPSLNSDAQPKALESQRQRGQRGGHGAIVGAVVLVSGKGELPGGGECREVVGAHALTGRG